MYWDCVWLLWPENTKEELGKVYISYNKVKDSTSLKENEWVGLAKKPPNSNLAHICLTGFLNRSLNILVKHFIVDKIQWNWRLFQHGFRDILVGSTVGLFPPFNNIINDFPFVLHPLSVFLKSPCEFFSWGYEVFPIISHRLNDRVI